jgi:hypothetical protein
VQLVPAYELLFVISHVYWREQSIHQVVEVTITVVNVVVPQFPDALKVVERNLVILDTNIADQVLHLAIGSFIQVGEHSVFHLGIILVLLVRADLAIHLIAENVLVSK